MEHAIERPRESFPQHNRRAVHLMRDAVPVMAAMPQFD
jgi:hypothetical protein